MKTILVCGGRDFTDRHYVIAALDAFNRKFTVGHLIHGDARGADRLGRDWARGIGVRHTAFPADWKRHGNSAGPIRNRQMLDQKPDAVIAFPGGRGTAHMVEIAKEAGVTVYQLPGRPANLKASAR